MCVDAPHYAAVPCASRDQHDRIIGVTPSLLEALVEEELGSVVFVMDYLQLDFGNARFSAYVWPTVSIGHVSRGFGDAGYRDALCALITHEVIETEESQEAGLVIRFGLGEVVITPEATDLSGPEIAMLQVHADAFRDASWTVWRPGAAMDGTRVDRDDEPIPPLPGHGCRSRRA